MGRHQEGLFDFEDRIREIGEKDPLAKLDRTIDWEVFREPIEHAVVPEVRGPGGPLGIQTSRGKIVDPSIVETIRTKRKNPQDQQDASGLQVITDQTKQQTT